MPLLTISLHSSICARLHRPFFHLSSYPRICSLLPFEKESSFCVFIVEKAFFIKGILEYGDLTEGGLLGGFINRGISLTLSKPGRG